MDIINVVDNLTEDMYLRFKCAVETGRWPEGTTVDAEQRNTAMQIVMAYQARRLSSEDIMTVGADGEIVTKSKTELKKQFASSAQANDFSTNSAKVNSTQDIARFKNL